MATSDAVTLELSKEELDLLIHMSVLGIIGLSFADKKKARELILHMQKIYKGVR